MTEGASPNKINWAIVWSAVAAVAAVGALVFAGLSYFQPSPYKLEARGEYYLLNYPNSLIGVTGAMIDSLKQPALSSSPAPTPSQPDTKNPTCEQFGKLVDYRHNFLFVLQNKGNKEVRDIKLMFPGGGLYELMRKEPIGKTETFNNEIPVGSMSPTEEVSILVWTNNERARDTQDRMRFVHPDGVILIHFPEKESKYLDSAVILIAIGFMTVLSSAFGTFLSYKTAKKREAIEAQVNAVEKGMQDQEDK